MSDPMPGLSPFEDKNTNNRSKILSLFLIVAVILLGVGGGFLLSKNKTGTPVTSGAAVSPDQVVKDAVFGNVDGNFKDTATGVIQAGGINGEGTHQLLREGGPSQTVYMTSSAVDLDQFAGKKVQIWGETFKAQKAGWLMDVGRVKILE